MLSLLAAVVVGRETVAEATSPVPITNVETTVVTTEVFLQWSGGPGATGEFVFEYDDGTGWLPLTGTEDLAHSTFRVPRPTLTADQEVHWRVRATDGSEWVSGDVTFTIPANALDLGGAPAAPIGAAVWPTTTRLYMSWSDGAGDVPAEHHRVEYLDGTQWVAFEIPEAEPDCEEPEGGEPEGEGTECQEPGGQPAPEPEIQLLEQYSVFYAPRVPNDNLVPVSRSWRVIAISATGVESAPTAVTFDVPPATTVPQAPTNLEIGFATEEYFLIWSPSSVPTPAVDYEIERKVDGQWVPAEGQLSITYSHLRMSRPHVRHAVAAELRIRAVNAAGEKSPWAEIPYEIPGDRPNPAEPTGLAASIGDDITISWDQSDDPVAPSGYELQVQGPDGTWFPTDGGVEVDVEGRAIHAPRPDLLDDTQVTVRLRATDGPDGFSAWVPFTFTIPANVFRPAQPIDVQQTFVGDRTQFSWTQSDSPVEVVDYLIEYSFDDTNWAAPEPEHYVLDVTNRRLSTVRPPGAIFPEGLGLTIRITPIGVNGLAGPPALITPTQPDPDPAEFFPSTRFSVGDDGGGLEVASNARLHAAGADNLDTFPDGSMGIVATDDPGVFRFFGPNGAGTANLLGTADDPTASVVDRGVVISPAPPAHTYRSGGPVFRDADGNLVLFYHQEQHGYVHDEATGTDQENGETYNSLGVAYSTDDGLTFADRGQIITSDIAIDAAERPDFVEIGGASYTIRDGYFYVYFSETGEDGGYVGLSVARAAVDDVVDAVQAGDTPTFSKRLDGAWTSPGIGGSSTPVFRTSLGNAGWPDVNYNACTGDYVMVYEITSSGRQHDWTATLTATSPDGLDWTNTGYLRIEPYERFYPTIADPDLAHAEVITGADFYLYETRSVRSSSRWSTAALFRSTVHDALAAEGCAS